MDYFNNVLATFLDLDLGRMIKYPRLVQDGDTGVLQGEAGGSGQPRWSRDLWRPWRIFRGLHPCGTLDERVLVGAGEEQSLE